MRAGLRGLRESQSPLASSPSGSQLAQPAQVVRGLLQQPLAEGLIFGNAAVAFGQTIQ